jgi:YegS/Rv2252/BmrU family lipid kinase
VAPVAERELRGHGLEVRRVDTRDLDHARALATGAARDRQTVVTVGGDGLIGASADALRHVPGAILGVIPGGRGNDLARVLGIPEDPASAAAIIAAGHARKLDLGLVEGEPQPPGGGRAPVGGGAPARGSAGQGQAFVGIASAGFDSDANRIANEAPSWLGGLVYAYGALRALAAWRPARLDIELVGAEGDRPERHSFSAFTVGACNSKAYGGGMLAAPGALLDDGLLDVVVLESTSKFAFLTRILPKVFKGTHVLEPRVHVFRARELRLTADRSFTMYADGDPIAELPVRVRALQGAVSVLVPAKPSPAFASTPRPGASVAES